MFSMKRIHLLGIVCIYYASIGQIESLNYGPANQFTFLSRAPGLPAKSEVPIQNVTVQDQSPLDQSFFSQLPLSQPRKTGVAYTIFHPLTFPQSRSGKILNLTLQPARMEVDQVQSRVMNQPEIYPNFGFSISSYNKRLDSMSPSIEPTSSDEYDDSVKQSIDPPPLPSPPKQYISKMSNFAPPPPPQGYKPKTSGFDLPSTAQAYDKRYQQPSPVENNAKSPRYLPQPQTNDKNIGLFAYVPPQRYNKMKPQLNPTAPPKIWTTTRRPNIVPPFAYNKNTVPKHKILPLQAYNKATFASSPVIPPPRNNKVRQQYVPCICVSYYLCKNGVINSGGRIQALQKRRARSLKYDFYNKTVPAFSVQSKISNAYGDRQVSNVCQPNEVCCQVYFGDNTEDVDDRNYYPVATPPPEPSYPLPPRFPNKGNQGNQNGVCGVRKVYGIQGRLKQLQYTEDVSEFGEYPWQVAILKKVVGDKNLYLCGGVLVSPQWVATVAHCIKKDKTSPILIRLGEWDVNRKDEVYPYVEKDVTTIVLHPNFDPDSLENDIALIRMIDRVDPRIPHINPACLPLPGQVFDNQKCWVSGWGKDFFGPQGEYQNVLKEVDVPVISRSLCSAELRSTKLGPDFKLHPGFLCAGGEAGKDACTGDGGSPLVCKSNEIWYVIGLVSWGIGCGEPGIPGVYVNVLYYVDWINSITRR